uniref:Uncharacterized protein n=1 Tax=Ciona savignyi TaxID=51511 RepID=H2ZID5_CIOSA
MNHRLKILRIQWPKQCIKNCSNESKQQASLNRRLQKKQRKFDLK